MSATNIENSPARIYARALAAGDLDTVEQVREAINLALDNAREHRLAEEPIGVAQERAIYRLLVARRDELRGRALAES
jgi:hypothetical protein